MFIASAKLVTGPAALLAGAAVPLGLAPFGWYPMTVLALAALAWLLFAARPRDAVLLGWLFGLGQFGVGVSWVYISIYLYGQASLALSLAVMLLLVGFLALFPAIMGWAVTRAGVSPGGVLRPGTRRDVHDGVWRFRLGSVRDRTALDGDTRVVRRDPGSSWAWSPIPV